MKQNIQLSVLPSVQSMLQPGVDPTDTTINGYRTDMREIITNLAILHNSLNRDDDKGKALLDRVISYCAYLYEDMEQICKEVEEYCK